MNAPLRFKEFNTTYQQINLANLLVEDIKNGTQNKQGINENYIKFINVINLYGPIIKHTKLSYVNKDLNKISHLLVNKGDLFYTRSSLTVDGIAHCNIYNDDYTPVTFDDHIMRVRINNSIASPDFIRLYSISNNARKYFKTAAKTGTMTTIGQGELKNLNISLPDLKEQEKISVFFKKLNQKIQLQEEKIDLLKEQKKGYMQKIISQELRFKDESGQEYPKWNLQIKADQLFKPISNKRHTGNYPVLSATQNHGMVYRDSIDRKMSFNDQNLTSYKLVEIYDFIISLRSFQGGIEFSSLQGLVSPAYTVFRKKSELVHELYFAKLFKTENFIRRLNSTTYGIRDGKAISYTDFSTLKFDVPCLEEQIKIASFLDTLEKKIKHETSKLSQLTQQKLYFMKQMFI